MDESIASFRREDRLEGVCLVVEGEVDLADLNRFHRAADALIADAQSPAIIDLRGVTFFNSTGIGALVTAKNAADANGVKLVVDASPRVHRVLQITGMADLFNLRIVD